MEGGVLPAGGQSLTYARGDSLTVETTALAVLAMLKNGQFTNSVNKALVYLVKSKGCARHLGQHLGDDPVAQGAGGGVRRRQAQGRRGLHHPGQRQGSRARARSRRRTPT